MLAKAGLLLRTVRHIPPVQLFYFFKRRMLPLMSETKSLAGPVLAVAPIVTRLQPCLASPHPELVQNHLTFLNVRASFTLDDIDWVSGEMPKLWRYHLHYFDWLKDPDVSHALAALTIDHWIEHNPQSSGDGWEPYPVSLRLVNWIKYCCHLQQVEIEIPHAWLISIQHQMHWLSNNIEWHIRANHLLKNLMALVWSCLFLRNVVGDTRLNYYLKLLGSELEEQFNDDGGHFERTPAYHALCLEDCMDLFNVISANTPEKPILNQLRTVIEGGLAFLQSVSFDDGNITLVGDSTFHAAHDWRTLLQYWQRINVVGVSPVAKSVNRGLTLHKSTGFCVFKNQHYELIATVGTASPVYQPGHSHCDVGSFELYSMRSRQRLIVDAGVSQYAPGPARHAVRTAQAHNVLTINEQEQHEIWGEFRMGARMVVTDIKSLRLGGNEAVRLEMQSNSAAELRYRHVRTWIFKTDAVLIRDEVALDKAATAKIRFNVHPKVKVLQQDDAIALSRDDDYIAGLRCGNGLVPTIGVTPYCPDFGVMMSGQQLCFTAPVDTVATFDFCLCLV